MITTTIGFAMHLYNILTSFQGIRAVGRALEYAVPYSNMASVKAKINFNTKHLQKGDPLPPFNGKLRVYNMRYCPFAQRTILALNAKEIDYEVVNIDLIDKPEWLHTKSAFTKVPALEIADGVSIYESLVTVEYLDDVYSQRPLLPKDPVKKAFDKIIVEAIGPVHSLFYKVIVSPELVNENGIAAYYKALDFIQDQLKQRGTTYLDGEQPGYADYMIWPWFERILDLDRPEIKIHEDKYKVLLDYLANMLKDPAVSQYLVPKEVFLTYLEAYTQKKKPNYDALLEE